jgi:7-cyano-7-deazaguanine reductase
MAYADGYDRGRLAPLERAASRRAQGVQKPAAFVGIDLWRCYEFSWLDAGGMPRVAGLTVTADAGTPCMVESKSMKLYLNGFAQSRFDSAAAVRECLDSDLAGAFGAAVTVALTSLSDLAVPAFRVPGHSLDGIEAAIDTYQPDPALLRLHAADPVEETLHTDLFRSVCPVTGQPDWATVLIRYRGAEIDRTGLLRYLVSYRQHAAFHETTVERIHQDIRARCGCERLLVAGYFQRRGGIDINPIRADAPQDWPLLRTLRQ